MIKIEYIYLKKNDYNTLKKLNLLCKDCLSVVEQIEDLCKNQQWYNEIIDLHEKIKNDIKQKETLTKSQEENLIKIQQDMRTEFDIQWGNSSLDLIRTILNNYPYDGFINGNLSDFELWDVNNEIK